MEQSRQIFSSGSESIDWQDRNCYKCKKNYDSEKEIVHCEIEEALSVASLTDGRIDKKLADKIGFVDGFFQDCPERIPINEKIST